MKITVNVECTPDEARQFLGLPDLKPIHAAVEERVRQAVADATPEGIMRQWLTLMPMGAEGLQKTMEGFLQAAARKPDQKPRQ